MTDNKDLRNIIELQLQQVYDPEFPLIDIWTLGLIYHIAVDEEQEIITITMTYTTPACPDGELMQQMIINQLQGSLPTYETIIVLTFEPMWTIKNIKDEDLQRMFM